MRLIDAEPIEKYLEDYIKKVNEKPAPTAMAFTVRKSMIVCSSAILDMIKEAATIERSDQDDGNDPVPEGVDEHEVPVDSNEERDSLHEAGVC